MKLCDGWLKVLDHSSLDPCPQAAEEIRQLRAIVSLINDDIDHLAAKLAARIYLNEAEYK